MQIAIIGCGGWCLEGHIPHWINAGAEIVALCDKNIARAEKARQQCKTRGQNPSVYTSEVAYRVLLKKERLDGVVVLTPPYARQDILSEIFAMGRSIFVEKPLCANTAQADRIFNAYMAARIYDRPGRHPITATGLAGRSPAIRQIKAWLEQGAYGKLQSLHFTYAWRYHFHDRNHWRGQPVLGGGHINEKFIHHLDALNWAVGPFQMEYASGHPLPQNTAVWKDFTVILTSIHPMVQGPVTVSATFGTGCHDTYELDVEFDYAQFSIWLDNANGRFICKDKRGNRQDLGDDTYWWPSKNINDFVQAFKAHGLARTTLRDAYDSVVLSDAIQRALGSSRTVNFQHLTETESVDNKRRHVPRNTVGSSRLSRFFSRFK